MGAANKVPGVSGGVVAFVAGFYEEFIYSLQKVNGKAFKLLVSGRFKSFYTYVNGRFLGLLFSGMIISYFSISKLLDYLIKHYELYVWSVFFGMIIASIYSIGKEFKDWKITTYLALCIGTLIGISISFLDPATENDNLLFVFFCGIISVSGMTLPGFSGSFILILLGNYVLLLVDSVNALFDTFYEIFSGDFSFTSNLERIKMLKVLAVFTLGSVVGLVTFSHILNYILKHYKSISLASILGFIVGSLGVVWPWKNTVFKTDDAGVLMQDTNGKHIIENYERYLPALNTESAIAVSYVILGIIIVLALEYYGHKTRQSKRIFGLVGKNIDYSFSRTYFKNKFKAEAVRDASYVNFDIATISAFENSVKLTPHLKGLNVTIPYKETIIPYLGALSPDAQRIGAVNTIKIDKSGKYIGYNTDFYGFKKVLQPYLQTAHSKALIFGTGGASKAVAFALEELGISYQLVSRLASNSATLTYKTLSEEDIKSHLILINCTPLGTHPNTDVCPDIPYNSITKTHVLFDLIYNPEKTKFLALGEKQNATIINGLKMLEYQAEKAWEIWNT